MLCWGNASTDLTTCLMNEWVYDRKMTDEGTGQPAEQLDSKRTNHNYDQTRHPCESASRLVDAVSDGYCAPLHR